MVPRFKSFLLRNGFFILGGYYEKLTGNQTRALFLEYFKKQGHMVEPSASLIPHDDPTLLWINAGVAALKEIL